MTANTPETNSFNLFESAMTARLGLAAGCALTPQFKQEVQAKCEMICRAKGEDPDQEIPLGPMMYVAPGTKLPKKWEKYAPMVEVWLLMAASERLAQY